MKDFDAQRHEREANTDGRSFAIGGETLVARASVNPDLWIDYFDKRKNTDAWPSNRAYQDFLDEHIAAVLEPGSVDAWKRVRTEADPPITVGDIDGVLEYLWEIQSGRPPTPQTDSSNGSAPSGTNSTDSSSSEPEEALTV